MMYDVPTRAFELTASVPASAEDTIEFLMTLDRHRGLHAFLQSAVIVGTGEADGLPWWDWVVDDRLPLGPFRYPFRYPARMTRLSPRSLHARVRAARGCFLESTTVATADGAGARIEERTIVTAPAPLLGYMATNAQRAHAQTLRMLPVVLSGGAHDSDD